MPRFAILSDVHSNLEALEAVLEAVESYHPDYVIHLGDLVGYNADPCKCLQILRDRKVISVLGNHDLAVLEPSIMDSFNVMAYQAIEYSRRQLGNADLRYLQLLPRVEVLWDRYLLCHGTPENLASYILNLFQAKRIFNLLRKSYQGIRLCFYGHTHQQKLWVSDPRGKVTAVPRATLAEPVELHPEYMYLINPGSVGQPRQKDNRAQFLLFDTEEEILQFQAVPYDIGKTQRKIHQADLPRYLAQRLQDGV